MFSVRNPFLVVFMAALMLSEATAAFETSMIYAAMKKLVEEFGDPETAAWLITIYLLFGAGMSAIMGRLGDMYGRKRLLLVLLGCGFIGSVLSYVSENFWTILAGRGLQGLTAALMPLCLGLIREHLPQKAVSVCVGLMVSAAGVGTISGLVLGGMIVDNFPWRNIFAASAVLTLLSLAASAVAVPKSAKIEQADKPDMIGGLLFVPGIALVLLAISRGRDWGWSSAEVLGSLAAGGALIALWTRQSLNHPNPLLNVRLFAQRDIFIAYLSMFLIALGGLQITQIFSLMMQQPEWTGIGQGLSATNAGLVKLPSNITSLLAGPIAGVIAGRFGNKHALSIACVVMAVGWTASIWLHDSVPVVIGILMVVSFGVTMTFTAIPNIVVSAAPADRVSEATGLLYVIRSAGMGVGAQLSAVFMSLHTVSSPDDAAVRYPSEQGFQIVLAIISIVCIAMIPLALRVGGADRKGPPPLTRKASAA